MGATRPGFDRCGGRLTGFHPRRREAAAARRCSGRRGCQSSRPPFPQWPPPSCQSPGDPTRGCCVVSRKGEGTAGGGDRLGRRAMGGEEVGGTRKRAMRLFLLSISLGVGLLPLRAGLSFSMDGFALCRVRLQLVFSSGWSSKAFALFWIWSWEILLKLWSYINFQLQDSTTPSLFVHLK